MADSPETRSVRAPTGEELEIPAELPVLPLRDAVVYPGVTVPLTIGRARSLAALEEANSHGYLLAATQRDASTEEPGPRDLHRVGCIVRVMRVIDSRSEGKQALVVGVVRADLGEETQLDPVHRTRGIPLPESHVNSAEDEATWQRVIDKALQVIELRDDLPEEWKAFISGVPTPGMLADLIASNIAIPPEETIRLLGETDPIVRLVGVEAHLEREVTIAETQRTLRDESEAEAEDIDPRRRERMLRRRMREIQDELGEADAGQREVDELRDKLEGADLPDETRAQAERELQRLSALPQHAPDRHLVRTYLEWMLDLPWKTETEDVLELSHARQVLDADHHGLDKVKQRILEYLAVRKLAPEAKAPILCFVGPPGVGKTSLGRSIARAMGRKFARASLGGVRDEAEIRGHRRTYVGAMPGRILQSIKRAGSRNPIFVLDEIDKLGSDFRGDPSSALLEVLDPEQNVNFSDHYIEVPFDLSLVLFVATANTLSTVPPALLDRMEVIELPGYTEREKQTIAREHLVPKQIEAHGLSGDRIHVSDGAIAKVVLEYTREAGVRNLERQLASLFRKAATRVAEDGPDTELDVDEAFVSAALGAPPHLPERAEPAGHPGVAVGLGITAHGGDILFVEATRMGGGKGIRLRLTGQMGDVMRESAEAALSWVRAQASSLGLSPEALEPCEIHLHIPAGAVPKDGPSAGVALVTAIVSALSDRRSQGTIAMTGEISLRGRVRPVGGIKGKVFAAARAGIETVVMPRRNAKDLVEIPEDVRAHLDIRLVDTLDEALAHTLTPVSA
ncbi:MAG: endopeptidase La [Myxococcota bacterium]|nr:endopeptidase La [Myxococcota bacterium]